MLFRSLVCSSDERAGCISLPGRGTALIAVCVSFDSTVPVEERLSHEAAHSACRPFRPPSKAKSMGAGLRVESFEALVSASWNEAVSGLAIVTLIPAEFDVAALGAIRTPLLIACGLPRNIALANERLERN